MLRMLKFSFYRSFDYNSADKSCAFYDVNLSENPELSASDINYENHEKRSCCK